MPDYVALIHKDADNCYGVSFPDIPGIFTGGDTVEEAIEEATELLAFAAEDWTNPDGSAGLKPPRTLDQLREDPQFVADARDATVVVIEYPATDTEE
jgi:predicted RNase H-like HicB family nuclease